jgi:hypothetical protein
MISVPCLRHFLTPLLVPFFYFGLVRCVKSQNSNQTEPETNVTKVGKSIGPSVSDDPIDPNFYGDETQLNQGNSLTNHLPKTTEQNSKNTVSPRPTPTPNETFANDLRSLLNLTWHQDSIKCGANSISSLSLPSDLFLPKILYFKISSYTLETDGSGKAPLNTFDHIPVSKRSDGSLLGTFELSANVLSSLKKLSGEFEFLNLSLTYKSPMQHPSCQDDLVIKWKAQSSPN